MWKKLIEANREKLEETMEKAFEASLTAPGEQVVAIRKDGEVLWYEAETTDKDDVLKIWEFENHGADNPEELLEKFSAKKRIDFYLDSLYDAVKHD